MSVINSDPKRKDYSDHSSYSYSGIGPKERALSFPGRKIEKVSVFSGVIIVAECRRIRFPHAQLDISLNLSHGKPNKFGNTNRSISAMLLSCMTPTNEICTELLTTQK